MGLLETLGVMVASKYIERSPGNIHEAVGPYTRMVRTMQGNWSRPMWGWGDQGRVEPIEVAGRGGK